MSKRKAVDLFAEAHATRAEIMRGNGGRGAQARLAACNAILENVAQTLEGMSDAQLSAHIDAVANEAEKRQARAEKKA